MKNFKSIALALVAFVSFSTAAQTSKKVDASKSSTKGTKDNPVFFISYKNETKNIFGRNYFISKKEIEEIFKN